MEIKKFESFESETEHNVYNQEIDRQIEKFRSDKEILKYYICTVDDKMPWQRISASDLPHSLDKMRLLNNANSEAKRFCIFEGSFKALTSEDVELRLSTKKYNL